MSRAGEGGPRQQPRPYIGRGRAVRLPPYNGHLRTIRLPPNGHLRRSRKVYNGKQYGVNGHNVGQRLVLQPNGYYDKTSGHARAGQGGTCGDRSET